jgi:hypothetical protein
MHTPSPAWRVLPAFACLLVLAIDPKTVAAGIDTVDIAEIAAITFGTDPAALVDELETPPRDRRLPDGFTNPDDEPRYPDLVEDIAPDFGGMSLKSAPSPSRSTPTATPSTAHSAPGC